MLSGCSLAIILIEVVKVQIRPALFLLLTHPHPQKIFLLKLPQKILIILYIRVANGCNRWNRRKIERE